MELPADVLFVIDALFAGGHDAWAVGGCVRDSLLGRASHDWDICTLATPPEIAGCFAGFNIVETGLIHGTVTVVINGLPIEITTCRADGPYTGNRRPQKVTFTRSLRDDMARRDFTINAMAYSHKYGLIDYFGGAEDIKARILRSVGAPDERFLEDGLRIMRALRFAAQLNLAIEPMLAASIHRRRELLQNISAERLAAELRGLITGGSVLDILLRYRDVLSVFIPEIAPAQSAGQRRLWRQTAHGIATAPPDGTVRLALLLSCAGKGNGGALAARNILRRLRFKNTEVTAVSNLVGCLETDISAHTASRWLNMLGEEQFLRLLQIKRALTRTARAKAQIDTLEKETRTILAEGRAFSLKGLAVSGGSLISAGVPAGPNMGILLRRLLDCVIDGRLPNEKEALLCAAAKIAENLYVPKN